MALKVFYRIDIHCEIQAVPFAQLSQMQPGEPSAVIRERVIKARQIQTERFSKLPSPSGGCSVWSISSTSATTATSPTASAVAGRSRSLSWRNIKAAGV